MRAFPRGTACLLVLLASPVSAQQPDSVWDVTKSRGKTREIDFTTSEGTWMSADVSPDGKWVVFDLLAHVYRVPIAGGTAEALTQGSGAAVNYHPRYSPDGKTIAFISDRKGQNNLWVMDADGSNPRPVFNDLYIRAVEPAWSADGRFIFVRRTTLPRGSGGFSFSTAIWMYHKDGGDGVEIIPGPSSRGPNPKARSASWPSLSRDGKFLYFSEDTPGETPAWTAAPEEGRTVQDVLQGGAQLSRLELATNAITAVTSGLPSRQYRLSSGGGYAGEVSPDGKWLAFARRIPDGTITFKQHEFGPRTALWIRDLETGAERVAMDPIEQDMAEGMKVLRVLPGYAWTPDGTGIVIASGGKLRRLDVASGRVTTIPFTARVRRTVSEQAVASLRIPDDPFKVKFARWHTGSPDGRRLAFQAVGRIWVADLAGSRGAAGQPRRLTDPAFTPFEHGPAWSPDGQWIAFTTVDATSLGHLWRVRSAGGAPEQLTRTPGEYNHPSWSADGREIVVARGAGASARGSTVAHSPYYDLVVVPAAGGAGEVVTRVSGLTLPTRTQFVRPTYGRDGRIYYQHDQELVSIRKDGSDRIRHLEFPNADEIVPSPTGTWAAFNEGDNIHLVALPLGTASSSGPIKVDRKQAALPVIQVSRQGGIYPRWRDSVTLELGSAARYVAYDVRSRRADTATVELRVPRALAKGTIAFTNARIVTLDGGRVIERGTVVIKEGRISCVGSCPAAADRTVNAAGKTIVPGFVDIHSHHFREYRGVIPPQAFEASVPLAFGVTTSFDNSMWSQDVFPAAELIEAGALIGPRTFSTGDPLYMGDGARNNDLTSYQVAEDNITRLASWGAIGLKQYLQPRRDQRQWVADVARKQGLMVTGEGDNLEYNISLTLDGQTGWEHPLSYVPLYGDVAKFFGRTGTLYSPTFMVGGPGPWNDEFFLGESEVWKNEKLRRWIPWQQLMPHTRRRALRPATDYSGGLLAQGLADILAEGGQGGIGSHGQQHGLASHWEIWVAASAMGPMGALELATWRGAKAIGLDRDVGSLTVGKLGDLIVLNSNPLTNIRNTADIRYVVKGGVLYDGETLDEQWPRQKPYGPRPWINPGALEKGSRPVGYWDAPRRD